MARMECYCGQILSITSVPNKIEYSVFNDEEYQDLINTIYSDNTMIYSKRIMISPTYDEWRCPECERLYVFEQGKLIKQYVLEVRNENNE